MIVARPGNIDQARARKELALAEKTEHRRAIDREQYVHIEVLERILSRFASAAGAAFDSIASRLKQKYPDLTDRQIDGIRGEIAEVRNYVAALTLDFE